MTMNDDDDDDDENDDDAAMLAPHTQSTSPSSPTISCSARPHESITRYIVGL